MKFLTHSRFARGWRLFGRRDNQRAWMPHAFARLTAYWLIGLLRCLRVGGVGLRCAPSKTIVLALALFAAGCATRGALPVGPELAAQLGFITPSVQRAEIEARLGRPIAQYENGSVVSYAVYRQDDRLVMAYPQPGAERFDLVLQYSADGRLMRFALVRAP